MDKKNNNLNGENKVKRPPVVVVMGHIDHGKSTLLDYIRKTNVVEKEAGGITQKISAYEVLIEGEGKTEKITFIHTPGHESFSKMRERGAPIADIAILIVSAEDGVKTQTVEAWKTIVDSKIPCIVAINKIDKPNANIEKTKTELAENEIYIENYGGKIPCAEISAKSGTGIDNLLALISIVAEMENFTGTENTPASGFILEANMDSKRGNQATLVIKNGTLKKGMFVIAEDSICSTNIIENFQGKIVSEATYSSPIRLIGFSKIPQIGADFESFSNKKEAEKFMEEWKKEKENNKKPTQRENTLTNSENKKIIPVILKADISGSLEAIEKEIKKIKNKGEIQNAEFKIIQKGVGPVSESDIKSIGEESEVLVIGFNVKADKNAEELSNKRNVSIHFFDIIYKMTEWLEEEMENRRPKIETVETTGKAKVLKVFSRTKDKQIIGAKTLNGRMVLDKIVKILRRDFEIGKGKILNLEKGKAKVKEVEEGAEFGMLLESKIEVVEGDIIESFNITQR